jgi:general secretion pathway protein M
MMRLDQKRLLWIAATLVLVLAVSQWLVRPILRRNDQLATNIQRSEERLQNLIRLEHRYREMLANSARLEQYQEKRQKDFNLFTFLEGIASREGLKRQIEFMRPSVRELSDTQQEEQVEMRLKDISLSRLIPYLYHIETAPEQVRIKRLTIRMRKLDSSQLEVSLVVVTRGLRKVPRLRGGNTAQNRFQPGA